MYVWVRVSERKERERGSFLVMSLTPSVNTIQGNDVSVPLFGSISFHERHVTYNATLLDWKEHTQAAATPFTRQKKY